MLTGERDPEIERLLTISRICESFGCLPSEAVRELDRDPEQLALVIPDLRAYAEAYHAYDRAKGNVDQLKPYEGNPYMTLVETHVFEAHQRTRHHGNLG